MRLNVILVFFLCTMTVMLLLGYIMKLSARENGVNRAISDVRTQSGMFINQLGAVGGLQSALTEKMINELGQAAMMYEGRILIVDQQLSILMDTYNMEAGKTLISAEVIQALRGSSGTYRNDDAAYIELTMPIVESETQNVIGVFLVRATTAGIFAQQQQLSQVMGTMVAFLGLLMLVFVLLYSQTLTRPLKKISGAIAQVTEGGTEARVSMSGYYELEQISDAFNIMLQQIDKLEKSRQEFVSNVSHELKTPMTSMKVLADSLLMQESVPEELYREFLTDINEEIERENKIISDLLSLVKLDRTDGEMHIAQVSINELLDIILRRLTPIAQKQGIELIYESFRNVIAEVDEVKLSLAISNLIENAIKYNVEGGWVKLSLNADHKYFYLRVADSGIGIPQEEQEHVFDRFYRVDKTRSRETGGSGLGLAIVKNIILMHKGSIKLFSRENEGSMFTVKIPLSFIVGQTFTE